MSSRADVDKAMLLLEEGRLKEAYSILRNAFQDCKGDWRVCHGLALLEVELNGNLEEGLEFAERARNLGCPDARYHRLRGGIFRRHGDIHEAVAEYEKAVATDRSLDNLVALADSLMNVDYARAEGVWKEIVGKEIDYARGYLALAWIARKRKDWQVALAMARKAEQIEPGEFAALSALAEAYQGLKQHGKAVEYYEMVKKDDADRAELPLEADIANCYLALEDYVAAIRHAYAAARELPDDPRANGLLEECKGRFLWLCGEERYDVAVQMLPTALEAWPDDSEVLSCAAAIEIVGRHDYTAGTAYMEKAFEHNNAEPDMLYAVKGTLWYDHLGRQEEGLSCLEKAVSIKRNKFNLISLAYRLLDTDMKRAEDIFREMLRNDPEDADAVYGLAEIALRQQKCAEGYELAVKAHSLEPDDPRTNALLGYAHFSSGNFKEALVAYKKAEALHHRDRLCIYNSMAECYERLGDVANASLYARKALSIEPDNPDAKRLASRET